MRQNYENCQALCQFCRRRDKPFQGPLIFGDNAWGEEGIGMLKTIANAAFSQTLGNMMRGPVEKPDHEKLGTQDSVTTASAGV